MASDLCRVYLTCEYEPFISTGFGISSNSLVFQLTDSSLEIPGFSFRLDQYQLVSGGAVLFYVTDHLPSPAHASGTACQPAFVTRHYPQEHVQHC